MNPGENVDQQWEYLSTHVKAYTIDMTNQYAGTCAIAVNSNILHFHSDIATLSLHIENVLGTIKAVQHSTVLLAARHDGKVGTATGPNDIQEFMNISEEYVILQHQLLSVLDSVNYINTSSTEAHTRAVAAQPQI